MHNFKKSLCFEVDNEKRVQIIIQKTNFHIWLFFWHQNDYEDRSFKLLFSRIGPKGPSGSILEFLWQFFALCFLFVSVKAFELWKSDIQILSGIQRFIIQITTERVLSRFHQSRLFYFPGFSWIEVRLLKNYTLGIQIQCLNGKQ